MIPALGTDPVVAKGRDHHGTCHSSGGLRATVQAIQYQLVGFRAWKHSWTCFTSLASTAYAYSYYRNPTVQVEKQM